MKNLIEVFKANIKPYEDFHLSIVGNCATLQDAGEDVIVFPITSEIIKKLETTKIVNTLQLLEVLKLDHIEELVNYYT